MLGTRQITFTSGKRMLTLEASTILYVQMKRNVATIHTISGETYPTRQPMGELEKLLGEDFLRVSRSTLVSVMAVHEIDEMLELTNGELLEYSRRNKKELTAQLTARQKTLIRRFQATQPPTDAERYLEHYRCFDALPIAFADIEMLFDEERRAVDWRFCYANQALAELEHVPLEHLLGATFSSLFHNMNVKWLHLYERAVLYHESLEVVDHSPEINADLRVACFPTEKGHCGCLLFPVEKLHVTQISPDGPAALLRYIDVMIHAE